LPPKCRQAFVMRRLRDMSLQEIADRMNISIKAVERHITLALTLLKKKHGGEQP
jgi:RNA polymerase sigma factor (sigma-70 family)